MWRIRIHLILNNILSNSFPGSYVNIRFFLSINLSYRYLNFNKLHGTLKELCYSQPIGGSGAEILFSFSVCVWWRNPRSRITHPSHIKKGSRSLYKKMTCNPAANFVMYSPVFGIHIHRIQPRIQPKISIRIWIQKGLESRSGS